MTKVDIFSGFLGAGKTTLIRKLIEEAYGTDKIDECWLHLLYSCRRFWEGS